MPTTPALPRANRRAIVAATIGNAFEWYDFIVFGFLSVIIARQFFPSSNPTVSMLLTTATFGSAFLMRPIGGILLGIYADRAGRKAALSLVILLMTVSSAMMALTPGYATIGIAAPIIGGVSVFGGPTASSACSAACCCSPSSRSASPSSPSPPSMSA